MKIKKILWFMLVLVLSPQWVYAGGAVARRRNMEQQRAVRQKMIEEQAKAIVQRKAQIVAQQQAQAIVQRKAQSIAYQKAAMVSAQMQNIDQINIHQPPPEGMVMDLGLEGPLPLPTAKAVATLDEVVSALKESSQDWDLIIDREAKEEVVSKYIEEYRTQGIPINKSPSIYTEMIDGMAQGSPEMLDLPFSKILMVAAIMQYDFNNGEDKDALAIKILGSYEAVRQNKEKLGL